MMHNSNNLLDRRQDGSQGPGSRPEQPSLLWCGIVQNSHHGIGRVMSIHQRQVSSLNMPHRVTARLGGSPSRLPSNIRKEVTLQQVLDSSL